MSMSQPLMVSCSQCGTCVQYDNLTSCGCPHCHSYPAIVHNPEQPVNAQSSTHFDTQSGQWPGPYNQVVTSPPSQYLDDNNGGLPPNQIHYPRQMPQNEGSSYPPGLIAPGIMDIAQEMSTPDQQTLLSPPRPVVHQVISSPEKDEALINRRTKPAPWMCDICSKTFTQRRNLESHLMAHYDMRPYNCSYCDKAFGRKSDCHGHENKYCKQRPGASEGSDSSA